MDPTGGDLADASPSREPIQNGHSNRALDVPEADIHHRGRACEQDDKGVAIREERGFRRAIKNFTPSWFAVTMGTGIVSILLHNLPFNGIWLYWLSILIFALNVLLFNLFVVITVLRYALYPEIWPLMIRHPAQSLFLGTIPMGLATIVNMIVFVCVPAWGQWTVYLLSSMTAIWLLPVVSTIVAAASGGIVANALPNPQHALWTLIISYVLWGTGVPLAMVILSLYFLRLTVHHLPPREAIVSVFLPLGPLGQGGFAIMQLGTVAMKTFPNTGTLSEQTTHAGEILYVVGWLVALIMWGFGLVWLFFALASISRGRFPFNMGWWGFTFPLGVFTTSTTMLGKEMPSKFFDVLGTIFSVAVVLLWIMVAAGTLKRAWTGVLFIAPCLQELEGRREEIPEEKDV
ncbi:MAG: hypothetical protein M1819_004024 [Sarea resinae]|nr:MAG: hypothetical protein M1819_004024 [Sarea resinae]